MSLLNFEHQIWRDHNGPVWSAVEMIAILTGDIAFAHLKSRQEPTPASATPTEAAVAASRLDHSERRAA